jgi:hypothetical protein
VLDIDKKFPTEPNERKARSANYTYLLIAHVSHASKDKLGNKGPKHVVELCVNSIGISQTPAGPSHATGNGTRVRTIPLHARPNSELPYFTYNRIAI